MSNDLTPVLPTDSPVAPVYTAAQLQPLLDALHAAKNGNFSVRLEMAPDGQLSELHRAFNDVVTLNQNMAGEIERVARTVGSEGRMNERASLPEARGSWAA